jgi:hypothetical protein
MDTKLSEFPGGRRPIPLVPPVISAVAVLSVMRSLLKAVALADWMHSLISGFDGADLILAAR